METPSSRLIATAQVALEAVDAQGRRLSLRRLTALDKLRLFKAAGPVLSDNRAWLGMALLACSVTAIDDVPVPSPSNESQIESMIQRLGDAGIAAIGDALQRDLAPVDAVIIKN